MKFAIICTTNCQIRIRKAPALQKKRFDAISTISNYWEYNLIYTEAVDRYLRTPIKDYDYQQHFGGVIYLFVRGVRKHSTNGIFITKPEQGAIGNILREVTETCEVK